MHWKSTLFGAVLATAAILSAHRVFSDDPPAGGPDSEAAKLAQPGAEHAALKQYEGTWEGKGTYRGMAWTSHQTGKMIMGGRFLQMDEEITIPIPNGPVVVHSMGLVGYDNVQKKYVNVAVGEDSTSFMTTEGQHDAAKKVSDMHGVEHRAGGKDVPYRLTITDVVDGVFHLELFMTEGAAEEKVMVADYTKK